MISDNGPEHRHYNIDLCVAQYWTPVSITFSIIAAARKTKKHSAIAGLSEQGGDNSCSYTFKYEKDTLAVMFSSFLADPAVVAEIHGTKGKLFSIISGSALESEINLSRRSGKIFEFDFKSNGYEYESRGNSKVYSCWKDSKRFVELE